jgi:hypothetical protein
VEWPACTFPPFQRTCEDIKRKRENVDLKEIKMLDLDSCGLGRDSCIVLYCIVLLLLPVLLEHRSSVKHRFTSVS